MDRGNSNRRLAGLDLFRIMITVWVFLFHSEMHFQCDYGILNPFIRIGAMDMSAFFMLSGFSLAYSNAEKTHLSGDSLNFYKKRFFAIYPLYWVVSALYVIWIGKETFTQNLLLLPVEVLGVQSAFRTLFAVSHNSGTWFISCMVICYILFPLAHDVIDSMTAKGRRIFGMILVMILLLAPLIESKFDLGAIYDSPFFRCLEFIIGILLLKEIPYMENTKIMKVLRQPLVILLQIFIFIVSVSIAARILPRNYMLFSWIGLPAFSFLLVSLYRIDFKRKRIQAVVSRLSAISYAFYLAQFFTWRISKKILLIIHIDGNLLRIFLSLFVCMAISLIFYYAIEFPCKNILKKYRGGDNKSCLLYTSDAADE